jgi:hypothetical protein
MRMVNDNQGDAFSKTLVRGFFAKSHGRASSSNPKWPSFPMTKDTQKALAIIIASLGVLVTLLFWANHLRPHP